MANSIVLFESADREVQLSVELDKKTVWLSQEQMADFFGRSVSVVSRHIGNAIREGEISAESNLQNFLDRNGVLFDGGRKLIDDSTLVAITIMIAESKPKEKDAMVALVMNFLAMGS